MFKHKTKVRPPECDPDVLEIKNRSRWRPIQHHNDMCSEEIFSGMEIWLIQTYFEVALMLPDCSYEDFVNAIFTITSGDYNTIDQSLLSAILSQETSIYLMQSSEFKNPAASRLFDFCFVS